MTLLFTDRSGQTRGVCAGVTTPHRETRRDDVQCERAGGRIVGIDGVDIDGFPLKLSCGCMADVRVVDGQNALVFDPCEPDCANFNYVVEVIMKGKPIKVADTYRGPLPMSSSQRAARRS